MKVNSLHKIQKELSRGNLIKYIMLYIDKQRKDKM